jgi:transposase
MNSPGERRHKCLTLVYPLDHGRRRLLHIARDRTTASFNAFFDMLGEERSKAILFVASDMLQAFLEHRAQAMFDGHSRARSLPRREAPPSGRRCGATTRGSQPASCRSPRDPAMLTKTRWLLLRRRENMSTDKRSRLREVLRIKLRSVRACLLKEQFQRFWDYSSGLWAEKFLARWTTIAMRSRLEPFKKFAGTPRTRRRELLAWFAARGLFANGATEGFNNKARIHDAKGVRVSQLRARRDRPVSRARPPTPARLAHPRILLRRQI